ncbi:MAG TPA: glycosyltransferase family A protein [bacterium]|nr:glycosyltransferase family A protein [bacterium]HOL46603.1 glycosyltransferase family A protein [bacterium]HPQ17826.1 glycosyltransferase family A protein [bacterium]
MKKVSVIITTYNRSNFVIEAINSVLNQSFTDFELFVVDDGSTDNTKEKVRELYGNKVNYIYQKNQGISKARNRGIEAANTEFIAFLDADDLWCKDKLKIQYNDIIQNKDIALNYTNEIWILNGKRINQKLKHKKYGGYIFDKTLPLCIISPSSALIRKSVFYDIGKFDENLEVCEDYDLWLRICLKYPVNFIDKFLIIKRGGHADQLSKKYWGMDIFRIYALLKLLKNQEITKEKKILIVNEIRKKYEILKKGCLKRNKNVKDLLLPFLKILNDKK